MSAAPPALGARGLPLIVGVTGHRDIESSDEAPLRAAFGRLLAELQASYPHSPLVVLSAMAAGADVIAVEEALARSVAVIAALPMEIERYVEDFSLEEAARFRTLLARCARVEVVAHEEERRKSYVAVGYYIAHYSHVVVAFWDGLEGQGAGGTADVVRMRLSGTIPELEDPIGVPYLPDVGPVYRIATPHRSHPDIPDAYAIERRYPVRFTGDRFAGRDFNAALKRFDLYNADLERQSSSPLVSLKDVMERTDAAANRLQRHTLGYVNFLYVAGFTAAVAYVGTGNFALKLGLLALAFFAYLLARRNDYENRYQDYRAIAEGLRVQLAWNSIGLTNERVEACYLRMQQSELQWIRIALRTAYLILGAAPATGADDYRAWIEGQSGYYERAARREAGASRVSGLVSTIVAVAAILVALYAGFVLRLSGGSLELTVAGKHLVFGWQTLVSESLGFAGALSLFLSRYGEKRSFSTNAKRYERMGLVFDKARDRLKAIDADSKADAKTLVRELGEEALVEHGEWLLIRRDRPLSFVHN